ncbi:MarR family transcriptional regulator [Jeotgalibaca sp. PTS2502]|jgi:MarR family transcriptional regulator, 2-MHQ and catechol-resistance regulon repressor|uniref:MarR family transcriptional regulator n=1 Tax=Jeotgalibaca arthritidis TaxID=1868794 RepID=A0A6G7K6Z7_9LACT|nr:MULTISPECIES: MarR family transcriptional regulator [Jeotgalibaca]APZ48617.1 MarR family transcriptional regulator [Jeotgalibaca sp. PTS2502]QII81033.1 MarR family transcriptional regulator [Jeotgalibaca arthritidis]
MSNRTTNSLKALTVLMRSSQHVQESIKRSISNFGLNPSEFGVLELLYHKGEQPIQNIGKKILLASSSLTYVIDKLESKGLVSRKPCETDRRVIFTSITEDGRKLMDEIFPLNEKDIEKIFQALEPSELEQYVELVKKVGIHAETLNKNK